VSWITVVLIAKSVFWFRTDLNPEPDTDLAPDLGFAITLEVIFYISYFPLYQNSTKSVNFSNFMAPRSGSEIVLPIWIRIFRRANSMGVGNTDGHDKVTEQVPGTTGFLFTKATEKGDLKKMECPNTRAGPNSNTKESSGKPEETYTNL
jgi:hypothetical protein